MKPDDFGGSQRNVLGGLLGSCSEAPITGFFRDGCCNTSDEDLGSHTICVVLTADFLAFSKARGNDLSTPRPEFDFPGLKPGDRFIYYAVEAQTFFAVVTITGEVFEADPKQHTFTIEADKVFFFPTDVDAASADLEHGVSADSIELESYPDFGKLHIEPESFFRISEDDFELLAEALTEITEDEEEETEEFEEYEEDEVE